MELIALFPYRATSDGNGFEIVDRIESSTFPCKCDINIFWALREDGKDHSVGLFIYFPGDRSYLSLPFSTYGYSRRIVLHKHESATLDMSVPGTYAIRLKVDGETVSEYPITVVKSAS